MSAEVDPATGELDPVNRWDDEIDQPSKPVVLMTEAEALKITAEIKSWAGTLWKKLKEAHDGQAWRALGYSSWRAYLDGEFDISKSQGYRLIAHARAVEELDAAAGFTDGEVSPAGDTLTERDTRDLDVEAVSAAVRAAFDAVPKGTTASSADLAAAIIASIVGQHRAPQEPGTTKTTTTTVTSSPDAKPAAVSSPPPSPQGDDRTGEAGSTPDLSGAPSDPENVEASSADDAAGTAEANGASERDDTGSGPASDPVSPQPETPLELVERAGRARLGTHDLINHVDPADLAVALDLDGLASWDLSVDAMRRWIDTYTAARVPQPLRSVQ